MTEREPGSGHGLFARLRERGVPRVAASYALIAWLLLQIADVVLDPLGVPKWAMTALIIAAAVGFPIAIALAWFLEIGAHGVEFDTAAEGMPRPTGRGLRHYADAIVIGLLLVVVAVVLVRQSDLGKPKPPENPAIAVLPFENLSGDPAQEYFADGFAQEVLDRLGRVPGLTVIARSSSFSFKGRGLDRQTIAGRLGVTTLLDGSVRRVGNRLKLSAELVDGATGRQLWSGTFDREFTDTFDVQEELAAAVIEAIVPAARGETMAKAIAPTTDMDAYDLYLLGRSAQEARTGPRLRESVGYFQKAIAMDPKYAKAHAALSRSLYLWTFYSTVPPPADAMVRAEAEAHKALAIDPGSSEAHAALATVTREKNPAGAEEEYKRALELNPNNAAALWDYGVLLSSDPKRGDEQRVLMERLERLDPRSSILWAQKLGDAAEQRDGDKAFRTELDKALAMLADNPDGLNEIARTCRGLGYAPEAYRVSLQFEATGAMDAALATIIPWLLVDDLDRAQRAADRLAQSRDGADIALAWQVEIAGLRGDFAAWKRLNDRLLETLPDDPRSRRRTAFWLAVQGRYPEAALELTKGEPLPDSPMGGPGLGGAMLSGKQLLPAVLRIYRATGHGREADEMAQHYFKVLRGQLEGDPVTTLDLAALAANEGRNGEAVQTLKSLFDRVPLVFFFYPQLPWFKSLEGLPAYDQLMAERRRRIDKAHAEMLRLEASARGSAPGAVIQLDSRGSEHTID